MSLCSRLIDRRYDARQALGDLVGKSIQTLTGRPNTVLALEGDAVRVATERTPQGALVPVKWVQEALDLAVLASLEETESSPTTMWVKRVT